MVMAGMRIAATTTSTSALISPDLSSGKYPTHVAIGATGAGAYIKVGNNFNAAATNSDLLIQPGDSIVLSVDMMQYVAAMAVSGASTVSVASLSVGLWGNIADSVAAMFASGEQGVWYDPSNLSSMFQDSAGTIPVTAVGQPVGRILDQSGRGNHATQAAAASRPLLQQDAGGRYYLNFDGVDDSLISASIDLTGTAQATMFSGIRKMTDTVGMVVESSSVSDNNPGTFAYLTGNGGANTAFRLRGSTVYAQQIFTTTAAPLSEVDTCSFDISQATSATEIIIRSNGFLKSTATSAAAESGSGNFGNYPIYVAMRNGASLPFTGRIYSLILRGATSTAAQIAAGEAYVNSKTGAY